MAHRRRRKNKAAGLKGLIVLLAAVLCVLVVLVLIRSQEPDGTLQTEPSTQGSTPATTESTPPTTQDTLPVKEGWVQENGSTYYYHQGVAVTGAVAIEGKIYCFTFKGELLSAGWQDVEGHRYYLNEDGSARTGWLELEDGRYYLRADGTMARGEEEIDGQRYFFTSAGLPIYLVNPWNYVPAGYAPDLKTLPTSISVEDKQVDASCYEALAQMMTDCIQAGHKVCVVSAYRTQEYQEYLFEKQVIKQMAALNCTREEAEKVAATISAIPGTSEHQLGLAVDIVDTQSWELSEIQETLAGQKWLMENSWKYGFILRYPNGTTSETGIIYEPWHYRYVGQTVAAELHASGQTLEGYLAALD